MEQGLLTQETRPVGAQSVGPLVPAGVGDLEQALFLVLPSLVVEVLEGRV